MRGGSTLEKRVLRGSLLVVLTTSLALTACGASRPTRPTGDALAATIRSRGGPVGNPGTTVSCVGRACTVRLKGLWDTAQVAWITAFGAVWSIQVDDEDDHFIRDLTVRLADSHSRRVAVFTCDLRHRRNVPSSADALTTLPSRLNCVETVRNRA